MPRPVQLFGWQWLRNGERVSWILDQTIHSMIERDHEQAVGRRFSPRKTNALTQNLITIEKFELVSFVGDADLVEHTG